MPIMVETEEAVLRSPIGDDNTLKVKLEEGFSDNESCCSVEVSASEWSLVDTCKRVRKLSAGGIRCSIYVESEATPTEEGKEVKDPFDGDPETLSNVSVSSSRSISPKTVEKKSSNVEDSYFSFGRKSPSTLKKEILKITDNQVSEANQYIAAKLERKTSLVSTCDCC